MAGQVVSYVCSNDGTLIPRAVWRGGFATYCHHEGDGKRNSDRTGSVRDGVVIRRVFLVVKLVLSLFRLPFIGDEFIILALILRFTLPLY
jgi:hypothetical protein